MRPAGRMAVAVTVFMIVMVVVPMVVVMTPRPGRIARILDIELGRPRDLAMEFTPEFKAYSDEVRALIFQQ